MPADYYKRIEKLLEYPYSPKLYKELYALMRIICDQFAGGRSFSNFFSQLGFVCEQHDVPARLATGLQALRRKVNHLGVEVESEFLADTLLLTQFVQHLHGDTMPDSLRSKLPADLPTAKPKAQERREYPLLRVRVLNTDDQYLYAVKDSDESDEPIRIAYRKAKDDAMAYIAQLVHRDSTLNLLDAFVADDGSYLPRTIVYEPDYLMSPSEVAAVFEPQGATPLNYLIKMLQPSEITTAILLGNFSGVMLDELLKRPQGKTVTYPSAAAKAFKRYPLELSLMLANEADSTVFHKQARQQFDNIRLLLDKQLEQTYGFDLSQALLEPSFVCPAVGLAGRMDYLQADATRLIEQKSGKRDEFHNTHREPHYVQMMLYQLMLQYTIGVTKEQCQSYLLYSRYPDGLMLEVPLQTLLGRAVEMRNRIVSMMERIGQGALPDILDSLKPEDFRTSYVSDKLWQGYIEPRISKILASYQQQADAAIKAYVSRYICFLAREQWLQKMGAPGVGAHGYADLWNNPALVRTENGDLLSQLKVRELKKGDDGAEVVVFEIPVNQQDIQTNFRQGDVVQFYAYQGQEPSATKQYTLRGRLETLTVNEAKVVLNNPQRNIEMFECKDNFFALEHDFIDSGNAVLYRGLAAMLSASEEKQNGLLLRKLPDKLDGTTLVGDYGALNELVRKERASQGFFLVVGPPGSGKTSCALRYMVEEELRSSADTRILLMAYTNRAVDELCGMLESMISADPLLLTDYLRIGQPLSASAQYRGRLLCERVGCSVNKADQLRNLLAHTRVVVATISTMSQQQLLLDNMSFNVAFVDEASQILEPYLLPIYTNSNINRYVLVGDQKQLPAVVQQSADDCAINDADLNVLGISNCAMSLFDRMLHRYMAEERTDLYHQLMVQGRMHPELYGFVNRCFYGGKLMPVPLVHQQREIAEVYPSIPQDATETVKLLARTRTLFINCEPQDDGVNDKINSAEAEVVVQCLRSLSDLYEANGRQFTSQEVGIIVPYRNQISMIRNVIQEHGLDDLLDVTIDTVERYQGSQRNVIIYTFTIRHESQLQFLTSSTYNEADDLTDKVYPVDRKLNVALTRAREQLILVGNKQLLSTVPLFKEMIEGMPEMLASK